MVKNPDPVSGMNIPNNFFRELRNSFLGKKIPKIFDADPDPGSGNFFTLDSGSATLPTLQVILCRVSHNV
jgi:hypothetical protein